MVVLRWFRQSLRTSLGLLVFLVAAGGCGLGGRPASGVPVNGRGMMGQGGAPRMMGRGQGVPPPTVTIAPTATPGGNAPISFSRDVLPILTSQCGSCHGGQGGLWLTTFEQIMVGGSSGPAVIPGRSSQSLLYLRITGQKQPLMPLNAPALTQNQIDAIKAWIDEGAPKN